VVKEVQVVQEVKVVKEVKEGLAGMLPGSAGALGPSNTHTHTHTNTHTYKCTVTYK